MLFKQLTVTKNLQFRSESIVKCVFQAAGWRSTFAVSQHIFSKVRISRHCMALKIEVFAAEGGGESFVKASAEASVEASKFSPASINSGGALNHLN